MRQTAVWFVAAVVAAAPLAAACGADDASGSSAPDTSAVSFEPVSLKGVAYDDDTKRQVLDIDVPAGAGPFPVVIAIHGGRFTTMSKRLYQRHVEQYLERGIAFAPMNYRLAPWTKHPGQVEDAHCALAWVHQHADEYRLDPSRVVVMGGSAGGYLTGMVATVDDHQRFVRDCPYDLPEDPVAAAIPMYGIFDVPEPPEPLGPFSNLAPDVDEAEQPGLYREMSPIAHVDGSEPPILAIHGTEDTTIPSVESERLVDALRAAGAPAELLLVEASHGFDMQPLDLPLNVEVLDAIEEFIAALG